MSTLLFSLRGVPDDESHEIKEILDVNNVDYYETSAGNWGVSMPALWVNNDEDLAKAQILLNEFHQTRATEQKRIYAQLKEEGKNKQVLSVLTEKPIRFLIYIGAILFILYLYIRMLFEFGL
jgi:hypothetical protein